ncbi:recombination directionality factor [Streptomyces fungicidicus]|uniref:recombination directionality factor n=1 Tax=Streptomyces fungicidicus TaxID=68203 RepID=UPI0036C463F1
MAMKLWVTDPENKPQETSNRNADLEGVVSIGTQDEDGNPVSLDTFRFATGTPATADAIAELFGGTPVETSRTSDHFIDVITTRNKLLVIVDGPSGLYSDMKRWHNGKLAHHCDGMAFLSHAKETMVGKPCGCPELFVERKDAAREGIGPSPSIDLTFRPADDPDLGKFRLHTGSWGLAKVLHEAEEKLERIDGPALVEISLELVEFTIKKGPKKGTKVSYYLPKIRPIKAYADAVADDPTEEYDGEAPF